MGTPVWRPDVRDLTSSEREREAILCANFIPWALTHAMRGRGGRARAKPTSAYKAYLGVRKSHSNRLVDMVSTKLVWTMVNRQCREYLEEFGGASLVIRRKQPFTKAILHMILTSTGKAGPIDLDSEAPQTAFRAFAALLRQTGFRKSELSLQSGETFTRRHATRANLSWCLRGRVYSTPPAELLRNPRPGDYAIVIPPVSKADPRGEVWGALPIYLHWSVRDADCAFAHLAQLELVLPASGAARAAVPLISPDGASPFRGSALDAALRALLSRPSGVGRAHAASYSWHSARIYLACALLAAGATHAQIQALCRWQTEDSLRIYARLNVDQYKQLLESATDASVHSVSTASLPPLSSELLLRELLGVSLHEADAAA